jgi:glycerophosphoryl diester phosphodiesterase
VWTVNDAAEARGLAGLGVDGICTDDVRLLDGLELRNLA